MESQCLGNYQSVLPSESLKARYRDRIVVCDSPNPGVGHILFISEVHHNWPSQRTNRRYPKGYIRFVDGRTFSYADETVAGTRVWLFRWNVGLQVMAEMQVEAHKVRRWLDSRPSLGDLKAFTELALERLGRPQSESWLGNHLRWLPSWLIQAALTEIPGYVAVLGLRDLRDLAALVEIPDAKPALAEAA